MCQGDGVTENYNETDFFKEMTLTEEQIENWSVLELENYLLTFIPTEGNPCGSKQ